VFHSPLSSISLLPSEAAGSSDARNAVVCIWDLHNAVEPCSRLHEHAAVDERLLVSARHAECEGTAARDHAQ
jgi:hypothetical protein